MKNIYNKKNKLKKFKIIYLLTIFWIVQNFAHAEVNPKINKNLNNEVIEKINDQHFLDILWENRFRPDIEQNIFELIKTEQNNIKNFNTAWKIARFVYYIGNFSKHITLSRDEKIKLFKYGYETALIAKELDSKKVEGYYWYSINLGSYGLEKGIFSALSNAKNGKNALLEAAKIDPTYHWCGPLRILGKYYQEVPGGIISFGDKKIAKEYYEKAINSCPNFRLNTIYMGVLMKKEGNKSIALEFFNKAKLLPEVDGKNEEEHYTKELAENIKSVQNT